MPVEIRNAADGTTAKVSKDQQLLTKSESLPLQHWVSLEQGRTFQAWGEVVVSAGIQTVLHIKNNDADRNMVVSYVRMQVAGASGGVAYPHPNSRFEMLSGSAVTAAGTAKTPINMNISSGNIAEVSAHASGTLTGGGNIFDTWYVESDGKEIKYNKDGSLILGNGDTLEIRHITDKAGGKARCRVTFMLTND